MLCLLLYLLTCFIYSRSNFQYRKNNVTIAIVQQNSVLPYSNKSIVLHDTSEKAHASTIHTTMNSSRWFYMIEIHNGMNSDTRNM